MGNVHSHTKDNTAFLPTELILQGMQGVDVLLLHVVAKTDSRMRGAVKDTLRMRMTHELAPFVPPNDIAGFFSTLTASGSVVAGSVAQAVLTPSIFANDVPNNLNIFIGRGTLPVWLSYLHDLAYVVREDVTPSHNNVIKVVSLKNSLASGQNILLSEGQGFTSITPIFGSSLTSQMNFFTQFNIYCMEPGLTLNLKTIRIGRDLERYYPSNDHFQGRGIKIINRDEEITLCRKRKLCRALRKVASPFLTEVVAKMTIVPVNYSEYEIGSMFPAAPV
ncbi:hypothetical protein GALMADRAFT_149011 [Galerina marginata CBS 339.88]|uniref:Uncharacterized protein n=1 Tax=Galerina marginata (strain CBS 339.88) TaxID=685588 RepID=A0A067SBE4_GALM3|nr:hypothetical protein GALMADRAFT_149011 [Galerina marginata CBS 339.88]